MSYISENGQKTLIDAVIKVVVQLRPDADSMRIILDYCQYRGWTNVADDICKRTGGNTPPFAPGFLSIVRLHCKNMGESSAAIGGEYRRRVVRRCQAMWGRKWRHEVIDLLSLALLGDTQAMRRRAYTKNIQLTEGEIEFIASGHGYEGIPEPVIKWLYKACSNAACNSQTEAVSYAQTEAVSYAQTEAVSYAQTESYSDPFEVDLSDATFFCAKNELVPLLIF